MAGYYNLVKEIALSDFKIRYQGSLLGVLWALVRPFLIFSVYYVVFSRFIHLDIPYYPLYLLLGIILWNFFLEATTLGLGSLLGKAPLIKKLNFPRSAIIVAATGTAFLNLLINLLVFIIFFAIFGPALSAASFSLIAVLVILYVFSLGLSLFLSAWHVRYKDVGQIWEFLLQIGFWLTPIVYSIEMIPERYRFFVALNPLAHIISMARDSMIFGRGSEGITVVLLLLAASIFLYFGYGVFKMREPYFAEEL